MLDPFLGSGTTVVAAYKLGRKAIGVEVSKEYFRLAVERMLKECRRPPCAGSNACRA